MFSNVELLDLLSDADRECAPGATTARAPADPPRRARSTTIREGMATMKGMDGFAAAELAAMRDAWRGVALDWALDWTERTALFPFGGEGADEPPGDTEHRMRMLIEVGHRLRFDDDDELREWLRAPLETLRWHSPLDVMSGTLADLRGFRALVERGLGS